MSVVDLEEAIGFLSSDSEAGGTDRERREAMRRYIVMKLLANGLPVPSLLQDTDRLGPPRLLATYHQRLKMLDAQHCPVDARIEAFLRRYFDRTRGVSALRLPDQTIILDRHGIARELSLPFDGDSYEDKYVSSYRVRNGVLHNPANDRRTTKGTFHIVEGGLPIPRDKKTVPRQAFTALFRAAMNPPADMLELPFTHSADKPSRAFVSLLIRPLLCPEVEGVCREQSMEVRFFAPGALVSNLDFVESIFGNAGDPFLPRNDAALDVEHWSGHTGCVILAPHLTQITKKEAGLPCYSDATDRQREDGMCWRSEDERYNDGVPFKLTCRDEEGVIVTLIADNYYGYCKKEVKTQLSYAANLAGNLEEEHAGGAIAFASFNLGDEFLADSRRYNNRTFDDVAGDYASFIDARPEGYGIDRRFPQVIYVSENARASVNDQRICWERDGVEHSIPLRPGCIYVTPSGYRFRLEKHPAAPSWRLIGTASEGVFCHKPCTVSGGGKSEISKSIADYLLHGPIFVADLEKDLEIVESIFRKDYSSRWKVGGDVQPDYTSRPSRGVLDTTRSLGSVIKLLTPSVDYTDEYNHWLESIPNYIYAIVFIIKRMHKPSEGDWRRQFTVDIVNGHDGHELKIGGRKLVGTYLRVGLLGENTWRTYKLRQDFAPAQKVQTEDDISASVIVPGRHMDSPGQHLDAATSYKFTQNCEYRLFQRPDDAIHRGLDKLTEADLSRSDNFIVNFEPLTRKQVAEICDRPVDLSQFTEPMQELLKNARQSDDSYVVCSATPRLVDGVASQNPRYLQTRPDLIDPVNRYSAEVGVRLFRAVPDGQPLRLPVQAVLIGRRNNPPDREKGIRSLAVYNPIHYQEFPELFMDFISSLTGKSPSTTGAGSEGALTKGPFNALLPIVDLNNAFVSSLLTGLAGFSTPAGFIGPNVRVDHDISLLIPEIWCRLKPHERDPDFLIREHLLEKMEDYEFEGRQIPASRLGYRITPRFIRRFAGRVFDNPAQVFDDDILRPETQDAQAFAEGVLHIAEAQQRVAQMYFEDGSAELACPPLKQLLQYMAQGRTENGLTLESPELRSQFTREALLASEWYAGRLRNKQHRDQYLWTKHVQSLEHFLSIPDFRDDAVELRISERLQYAREQMARSLDPAYLESLKGTLGASSLRP
ncbi:MAG: hypothetical protein KDA96_17060 [Planctomycetaceae bacterium]|nr:hypothetical protein [Planctomycetaceae bacterium]